MGVLGLDSELTGYRFTEDILVGIGRWGWGITISSTSCTGREWSGREWYGLSQYESPDLPYLTIRNTYYLLNEEDVLVVVKTGSSRLESRLSLLTCLLVSGGQTGL